MPHKEPRSSRLRKTSSITLHFHKIFLFDLFSFLFFSAPNIKRVQPTIIATIFVKTSRIFTRYSTCDSLIWQNMSLKLLHASICACPCITTDGARSYRSQLEKMQSKSKKMVKFTNHSASNWFEIYGSEYIPNLCFKQWLCAVVLGSYFDALGCHLLSDASKCEIFLQIWWLLLWAAHT